jgi:hypothetical protein
MSEEKRKKRNRLITNFWVAKPKKLATPRCFYETRVIESKSKTQIVNVQGKGNILFRKQEKPLPQFHLNTWLVCPPVFMPSDLERQRKF